MDILIWITQACDTLTSTVAPSVDAMGVHICVALATIMLVWFGVQEALASAQGGPGFSIGKFLNFFMLITFAYVMVKFFDSSIPGIGYSLKGFINGGAQQIVGLIGTDSASSILSILRTAEAKEGPGMMSTLMSPYNAIIYALIQVLIAGLSALISVIIAYGAIASTIVGLLGPVFIPFLVFEKLDFLFWGWLRAFLGFTFYKVVAAATLSILSHLLANYYALMSGFTDPATMIQQLPVLILLVMVNGFILLKIPAMTATIFSGHTSGHDAGTGIISSIAMTAMVG
jgi:type IV secretory pathway VirB6-like protein